jgi:hypothetical protein
VLNRLPRAKSNRSTARLRANGITESSDFTLDDAVADFVSFRSCRHEIRSEPAISGGESDPARFHVDYEGGGSSPGWGPSRVWSDDDKPDDHSDEFSDFTDVLQARFRAFILDTVNCGRWT